MCPDTFDRRKIFAYFSVSSSYWTKFGRSENQSEWLFLLIFREASPSEPCLQLWNDLQSASASPRHSKEWKRVEEKQCHTFSYFYVFQVMCASYCSCWPPTSGRSLDLPNRFYIYLFVRCNDCNTDGQKSFSSIYIAVGASLFNFFTKENYLLISMILQLFIQKTTWKRQNQDFLARRVRQSVSQEKRPFVIREKYPQFSEIFFLNSWFDMQQPWNTWII